METETMGNRLSINNGHGDYKLKKRKIGETHSIYFDNEIYSSFSDKRRPDGKSISIY